MSHEPHLDVGAATRSRRDRRSVIRLDAPLPAIVRHREPGGRCCEEETTLDNMSAHGLYARLSRTLVIGKPLFVLIRFTVGAPCRAPGHGVAIRGVVLRTDALADGRFGVAVLSLQHRLIFNSVTT